MNIKKLFKYISTGLASALLSLAMPLGNVLAAGPSVSIVSPVSSQQVSGNSVLVEGMADPGTTVSIYLDSVLKSSVVASGLGEWEYSLTGVSGGNHSLEARTSQAGDLYFSTIPSDSPSMLNNYNIELGSMNNIPNFPVYDGGDAFVSGPVSPDGSTIYLGGYAFSAGYLSKVDIASGAVSAVSGLPGTALISIGSFSPDGGKYFAPDISTASGSVYVVDVASNEVIDTIHINGTDVINYSVQFNDSIYVSNYTNGHIYVINPNDHSFTDFDPGCLASAVFAGNDASYFWVGCQNGDVLRVNTSSNAILQTIATPLNGAVSISEPVGSNKLYVTDSFGDSTIYIYNADTGSLLNSIDVSPESVSLTTASNDGSKVFAPMSSFGSTDMMIINVADDSTSLFDIGDPAMAVHQAPDLVASDTVSFSVISGGIGGASVSTSNSDPDSGDSLAETGMNSSLIVILSAVIVLVSLMALRLLANKQKYQLN